MGADAVTLVHGVVDRLEAAAGTVDSDDDGICMDSCS